MTPEERQQKIQDEVRVMMLRETISLVAMAAVLIMLSPGVQNWARHQVWRMRQWQRRASDREESMVAELRRDISQIEHGQVEL